MWNINQSCPPFLLRFRKEKESTSCPRSCVCLSRMMCLGNGPLTTLKCHSLSPHSFLPYSILSYSLLPCSLLSTALSLLSTLQQTSCTLFSHPCVPHPILPHTYLLPILPSPFCPTRNYSLPCPLPQNLAALPTQPGPLVYLPIL